jgi:hypothetical protein
MFSTQKRHRPHWVYQPDRRVVYKSNQYPWLIAAHRYHNKVNMHAEWDLVKLDFPDYVFNRSYMAEKGQDYIVHYSAISKSDSRYATATRYRHKTCLLSVLDRSSTRTRWIPMRLLLLVRCWRVGQCTRREVPSQGGSTAQRVAGTTSAVGAVLSVAVGVPMVFSGPKGWPTPHISVHPVGRQPRTKTMPLR